MFMPVATEVMKDKTCAWVTTARARSAAPHCTLGSKRSSSSRLGWSSTFLFREISYCRGCSLGSNKDSDGYQAWMESHKEVPHSLRRPVKQWPPLPLWACWVVCVFFKVAFYKCVSGCFPFSFLSVFAKRKFALYPEVLRSTGCDRCSWPSLETLLCRLKNEEANRQARKRLAVLTKQTCLAFESCSS